MLRQIAFIAQRALTQNERFLIQPLFMLAGVFFVYLGIQAIKTKRVGARSIERLLYGRREYTGKAATFIGVGYCLGGLFICLGGLAMMILGRTLLPE